MIKFNPKKLKIVDISEVRPNSWNPKKKDTVEYQKIKNGIKLKGQRLPVVVRENKGYEIIDGEQRWTAMKELDYKNVLIYNEGEISDKEAKELTIWYQQQVPFDEIMLAELIAGLSKYEKLELPFSNEEIEEYKKLFEFDFNQYDSKIKEELHKNKEITCPQCGHEFEL